MSARAKILVVEDEPMVRRVCEAVLERNNFHPILTENGAEALDFYKRAMDEIVLVLSDVRMPVMNGIDMARQMFTLKPHSNVILMTGYNSESLVPEDLKRLCSTVNKPFTALQLITAVKKCLKYEENREDAAAAAADGL